jgi:hypothetical protein
LIRTAKLFDSIVALSTLAIDLSTLSVGMATEVSVDDRFASRMCCGATCGPTTRAVSRPWSQHSSRMASCSWRPESVLPCGAGRSRPSPNQGGAAIVRVRPQHQSESAPRGFALNASGRQAPATQAAKVVSVGISVGSRFRTLILLARPTRFERVTFDFGGQNPSGGVVSPVGTLRRCPLPGRW